MRNKTHKNFILATIAFVVITLVGLWSWNTVIELFDGPRAEYHHIVAMLALVAVLRAVLIPVRAHRRQLRRWRRAELERSS